MLDKSFLLTWLLAFLFLVFLDIIWFSLSFKKIYEPQFKKIQKRVVMRIWSAILVWLLLSLLVSLIIKEHPCPMKATYIGLIMGFIVYGVYNFTNYSTLANYSLMVSVVDSFWGAFALGTASFVLAWFSRPQKLLKGSTPK